MTHLVLHAAAVALGAAFQFRRHVILEVPNDELCDAPLHLYDIKISPPGTAASPARQAALPKRVDRIEGGA